MALDPNEILRSAIQPRYSISCWNCDEGHVETDDEWGSDVCDVCQGKGVLVVTELTDENCEDAVRIED